MIYLYAVVSLFISIGLPATARAYDAQALADCLLERSNRLNQEAALQTEATLSDTKADYLPSIKGVASRNRLQVGSSVDTYNSVGVTVEQKVFDAALIAGIDAAKSGLKAARSDVLRDTLGDALEALSALVALQRQIDQNALIQAQTTSYEELVNVLSEGSHVGLVDANDLLQAKAVLLADQIQIKQLSYDIETARSTFRSKFGFESLALTDFALGEDRPVDVERLPGLRVLRAQIDQIQYQKKQADRDVWPQVSLQGSYSSEAYTYSQPNSATKQGAVSLVLDLSGLWKTAGRRQAYSSITDQRRNQLEQQVKELKNDYQQIDHEIKLIADQKPLLSEREDIALKSRDVSKAKLRLGRIGFLELQQTESAILSAGLDRSTALNREKQLHLEKELAATFTSDHPQRASSCPLRKP